MYPLIGISQSSMQTIVFVIPQGSTLGPLLFLHHINDITNSSDNTDILASSKNPEELETTINQEFIRVNQLPLEQKDHIQFPGVMIDHKINWKYYISFICSRISRNTGIFYKLRHYLSPLQLRQLYYNLIFPYQYLLRNCCLRECPYKSHLSRIKTKQNHMVRIIFFATSLSGENTGRKSFASTL